MMTRLSNHERSKLRQLIIESEVMRDTREEMLVYVRKGMNLPMLSDRYIDMVRHKIRNDAKDKLKMLHERRYAYLQEFFSRIEEMKVYQKAVWKIVNNTNDPKVQLSCISELASFSVILVDLYSLLPDYVGTTDYNDKKDITTSTLAANKETEY